MFSALRSARPGGRKQSNEFLQTWGRKTFSKSSPIWTTAENADKRSADAQDGRARIVALTDRIAATLSAIRSGRGCKRSRR